MRSRGKAARADLIICEQERGNGVDRANRIRQLTLLSLYPWRRGALASTQLIERSLPNPGHTNTHTSDSLAAFAISSILPSIKSRVHPPPTLVHSFPPSGAFYLFLLYSPRFAVIHCLFNHSPQERGGGERGWKPRAFIQL